MLVERGGEMDLKGQMSVGEGGNVRSGRDRSVGVGGWEGKDECQ